MYDLCQLFVIVIIFRYIYHILMDAPQPDNKSDAQVQMLSQFDKLQFQNETLKSQCDRLQKLLDQITCSNDSQRTCTCGRKLRYLSSTQHQIPTHLHSLKSKEKGKSKSIDKQIANNCNKCGDNVQRLAVWWNCCICSYYTCVKCEGYKKSVCPFSHILQYKKFNYDIEQQQQHQLQKQQRQQQVMINKDNEWQDQKRQQQYKKQKQNKGQKQQLKQQKQEVINIRSCFICNKEINKNYYSCTCGFDMCKECRQ